MVKPKKHLGQHFLTDESICVDIADAIVNPENHPVIEVGPGTGALTKYLLERDYPISVAEIDRESIEYLRVNYPDLKIFDEDFMQLDFDKVSNDQVCVVGNFPYNVSSQILFKVYDERHRTPMVVGMFQKEVAQRVAEKPGTKQYGILSVLLQAFYDIEYLFTVDEHVFNPPPKVKSGVIRMTRNNVEKLDCDEKKFKQVIKLAFNQRRKTLRNSLKSILGDIDTSGDIFQKRPEQLSPQDFIELTNFIFK